MSNELSEKMSNVMSEKIWTQKNVCNECQLKGGEVVEKSEPIVKKSKIRKNWEILNTSQRNPRSPRLRDQ